MKVYPRQGSINPGDFCFVKFSYQHFSVGTHILPFIFNVKEGNTCVLYCKAHTLPPNIGRLSARSNKITLRPVPIGYTRVKVFDWVHLCEDSIVQPSRCAFRRIKA